MKRFQMFLAMIGAVTLSVLLMGAGQNGTATGANEASRIQGLTGCTTSGYVFTPAGSDCVAASAGTVTSVGWTGGIVSVATSTTTPAFTVAGTSGGVPYFSSTSAWGSSALLTQYGVMYGGGAAAAPVAMAACGAGLPVVGSATVPVCATIAIPTPANSGEHVAQVVASGTSALATSAISSGVCASAVTTTATGTATTDVIGWGFNGDPTGVTGYKPTTGGMLTIIAYPSSGNVNFKVCNNTAASITPGAITLNWYVHR